MKTISTALKAHLAQPVTTLAACWILQRTDGQQYHYTTCDQNLVIDNVLFDSVQGFSRSAISTGSRGAVDNLEIIGYFDNDAIAVNDIKNGLFNYASIWVFLVNWADLTQGILKLRRGWLGECTRSPSGIFHAELRGLTQALTQEFSSVLTPNCRADLGDTRCKVPLIAPVWQARTDYVKGQYVRPTQWASNDSLAVAIFQAQHDGTSGFTEPTWNLGFTQPPAPPVSSPPVVSGGTSTPPVLTGAYKHVVLVMMENHAYSDIVGAAAAPYINGLIPQGCVLSNYHAITHPSEPNYFALFSGSTQGVTDDGTYSFPTTPTIAGQLVTAGGTFTGFAELSGGAEASPRKHNPWESFGDSAAYEKDFATFPSDFTLLPDLAWVSPNLLDDMHDGTIAQGDTWLQTNLDGYIQWAKTHNALFILVFDESTDTDPTNRVLALLIGQGITAGGDFTTSVNHYSLLRYLESLWGLPYLSNAATATLIQPPATATGGTGGSTGAGAGSGGSGSTPTVTATGVLNLLTTIQGTRTLSFQFVERGYDMTPIAAIHTATGKWLAGIGGDYWYYNAPLSQAADTNFNAAAIAYWNAGGLVTLITSMPNPQTGGGQTDTTMDFGTLLTPGTTSNLALYTILDQIAVGLTALRDAGVAVLYRPFHELQGNWFWWGTPGGTDAQFVQLWQLVHTYFTVTKGLNNLIWIWSVNGGINSSFPIGGRYPGAAYVDVTGIDVYTSDPASEAGEIATLQAYGKPVWFAEFGSGGPGGGDLSFDETVLINAFSSDMPIVSAFQQWWAQNAGGNGWGIEEMQNISAALNLPRVMNRGDFTL